MAVTHEKKAFRAGRLLPLLVGVTVAVTPYIG